jgi:hypothetical protein
LADPLGSSGYRSCGIRVPFSAEDLRLWLLQGLALSQLDRAEGFAGISRCTCERVTLFVLADLDVAALQVRALPLSGLAAGTADPLRAIQALEALAELPGAIRRQA